MIACLASFAILTGAALASSGSSGRSQGTSSSRVTAGEATTGPRGPVGPSDGNVVHAALETLPAGADTVDAQFVVPANGSYIVTASTELGNASTTAGFVGCTLLAASNPLGQGTASLPDEAVFADTMTLTGATTTGGVLRLSCNSDNPGRARNTVITAIRVGTLHTS